MEIRFKLNSERKGGAKAMRCTPTFALKNTFFTVIADFPTEHLAPQNNVMLTESQDLTCGLTGLYSKLLTDIIISQEKAHQQERRFRSPQGEVGLSLILPSVT